MPRSLQQESAMLMEQNLCTETGIIYGQANKRSADRTYMHLAAQWVDAWREKVKQANREPLMWRFEKEHILSIREDSEDYLISGAGAARLDLYSLVKSAF